MKNTVLKTRDNKYTRMLKENRSVIINHYMTKHELYPEYEKLSQSAAQWNALFDEYITAAQNFHDTGEIQHEYRTIPCKIKLVLPDDWRSVYFPNEYMECKNNSLKANELYEKIRNYAIDMWQKMLLLAHITKYKNKEIDELMLNISKGDDDAAGTI